MSQRVYFLFSTGLKSPVRVPKGTLERITGHVADVEETFGFEVERYKDSPPRWKSLAIPTSVDDDEACQLVSKHNDLVRWLYETMARGVEKGEPAEKITPKRAETFWHALVELEIPVARWSPDYYRERMDTAYAVMRGHETEGTRLDAPPLTPEQAGAVIRLFESYLDPGDLRLEVPKGRDELMSTDEYYWCSKCGAIAEDDARAAARSCAGLAKGECDLQNTYEILDESDEDEEIDAP